MCISLQARCKELEAATECLTSDLNEVRHNHKQLTQRHTVAETELAQEKQKSGDLQREVQQLQVRHQASKQRASSYQDRLLDVCRKLQQDIFNE